jgi:hypothetical protein
MEMGRGLEEEIERSQITYGGRQQGLRSGIPTFEKPIYPGFRKA